MSERGVSGGLRGQVERVIEKGCYEYIKTECERVYERVCERACERVYERACERCTSGCVSHLLALGPFAPVPVPVIVTDG